MIQFKKTIVAAIANQSGAMEADTISKNGQSSKSHTSRVNLFIVAAILTLFAIVSGCRSVNTSLLRPKTKIEKLLPVLTPVFDDLSFSRRFVSLIATGVGTATTGESVTYSMPTYYNPNVSNFFSIFQRNVEDNICVSDLSKPKGSIKCSLIDAYGNMKTGWAILSVCLLCIPNLFGLPLLGIENELQIEVSIFDSKNDLVGRYRSDLYKEKSYFAMYWGYNAPEIRNNIVAFTKCMEEIKHQIEKDYDRLNAALN